MVIAKRDGLQLDGKRLSGLCAQGELGGQRATLAVSLDQGDAAAATGVVLRVGMADKLVFAEAAENFLTKISGDALAPELQRMILPSQLTT